MCPHPPPFGIRTRKPSKQKQKQSISELFQTWRVTSNKTTSIFRRVVNYWFVWFVFSCWFVCEVYLVYSMELLTSTPYSYPQYFNTSIPHCFFESPTTRQAVRAACCCGGPCTPHQRGKPMCRGRGLATTSVFVTQLMLLLAYLCVNSNQASSSRLPLRH